MPDLRQADSKDRCQRAWDVRVRALPAAAAQLASEACRQRVERVAGLRVISQPPPAQGRISNHRPRPPGASRYEAKGDQVGVAAGAHRLPGGDDDSVAAVQPFEAGGHPQRPLHKCVGIRRALEHRR